MSGRDWTPTRDALPPEGALVEAMDSGGHVQTLRYSSGLWWLPDQSMYVYFTPQFWRLEDPKAHTLAHYSGVLADARAERDPDLWDRLDERQTGLDT